MPGLGMPYQHRHHEKADSLNSVVEQPLLPRLIGSRTLGSVGSNVLMPPPRNITAGNRVATDRFQRALRKALNMPYIIDLIKVIFHPTRCRRPTASLDGSWVE
jgi:hypothetical protein